MHQEKLRANDSIESVAGRYQISHTPCFLQSFFWNITRFSYDGNQLTRAPVFVAAIVTVVLSVTAVVVLHALAAVTLELVAKAVVT